MSILNRRFCRLIASVPFNRSICLALSYSLPFLRPSSHFYFSLFQNMLSFTSVPPKLKVLSSLNVDTQGGPKTGVAL
jgi:hypothetical protein